jgi:hypothetical protein
MGGGTSRQSIKQFFEIDSLNETITNQLTKNRTSVASSQTNIQKLSIVIGGSVVGCDIKTGQKIEASNQSTVDSAVSAIVDMKQEISSQMEQSAAANMEMLSELGDISGIVGAKTNQDIEQTVKTMVKNIVETNISEENITELMAEQVNIQSTELIIGGTFDCRGGRGTIDASQDVVAALTASAVSDMLTEKLLKNEMVSAVVQKAEAGQSKKNTGVASIVDSIGSAISGIINSSTGIFYIIGCVLCVALIGLVVFMMSPAGQNVGKAGASKISGPGMKR